MPASCSASRTRDFSNAKELRWGTRGSFCVKLGDGVFFDNESQRGGGVLDLVERQTGLRGPERWDWLTEHGYVEEQDREQPRETRKPNGAAGRPARGKVVAAYPYVDEAGELLFEVVKYDPKDFRQRRPDGTGGHVWSTKGVKQVVYRLPDVIEAIAQERPVILCEGEKDADNLWALGIPATCNAGGVGKWREDLNDTFANADVVVIPDHDPQKKHPKTGEPMFHADGRPINPGRDHAHEVCAALDGIAYRVRFLDLGLSWPDMPEKGDVSDWIKAGGTREALDALVDQAPEWTPALRDADIPEPVKTVLPLMRPFPITEGDLPRRSWIVPGLILRSHITLFIAPPGTGKSLLTLQLGIFLASDMMEWAGWKVRRNRPLRVLIINCEEDYVELQRRLFAGVTRMNVEQNEIKENIYIYPITEQVGNDPIVIAKADFRTKTVIATPMLETIIDTIKEHDFDVVVVDPFAETFAGNENDNSELKWAAVLWRKVARATNVGLILVHHSKKYAQEMAGDADAGRGGNALVGIARIAITMFNMTASEAEGFNIERDNHREYVRNR